MDTNMYNTQLHIFIKPTEHWHRMPSENPVFKMP